MKLSAEASTSEEPGAENQQPGSMRGLLGNWQSYRNARKSSIQKRNHYRRGNTETC
jgi:hypothetical protein